MNPPDHDVLAFIKDFLWAPLLGLVAWAWHRNEKEHDMIRAAHTKAMEHVDHLKSNTSSGYSILNDRVMEHIDKQINEVRTFVIQEDAKLIAEISVQRGHIGKIFDKMEAQSIRSEDRHSETMQAIHHLATTMHQALAQKADR